MGHRAMKDGYAAWQEKLQRWPVGAPGQGTIQQILRIVATTEEAELLARLPWSFRTLDQLSRRLRLPGKELAPRLEALASKGLVMDLMLRGRMHYVLTPTVVGFFEFSMMRVREDIDQAELAKLFHRYMLEETDFKEQFRKEARTSPFRTLVHEEALPADRTEVLDWERATHMVGEAGRWAVGLCHCRHVAHHRGEECTRFRMDSCLTLGEGVDYLVRRGFAREVSRDEALALIAETRDAGLVHLGDNVQRKATFVCNCCSCCCGVLNCFKKFRMFGNFFSSNFEAQVDQPLCNGCMACQKACPVVAIDRGSSPRTVRGKQVKHLPLVDREVCLGCGVCALTCKQGALKMAARARRRITPESTFARILSMALEQGRLHELLIDADAGLPAAAASALLGAILRLPPARQLLVSEALESRFVNLVIAAAKRSGAKEVDI